jgi:hypothetical protein
LLSGAALSAGRLSKTIAASPNPFVEVVAQSHAAKVVALQSWARRTGLAQSLL